MPQLIIQNLTDTSVTVTPDHRSVLQQVQTAGIDWMHACGGKGRCTTCKMVVLAGMAGISDPSVHELKYRSTGRLQLDERLACQCRILSGDVIVRIPRMYQLPHMQYSE